MKIERKALKVIEGIISAIEPIEPEDKLLQACYRFAHVGLGNCKEHKNWVKELNKTYVYLVNSGIIEKEE